MTIRRISSGGLYEQKVGYCRAVVAGGFVHVSGCVAPSAELSTGVVEQCAEALAVIKNALEKAGASFADVVRVAYIVPDPADFKPCWPLLEETFGANPPAATMISAALIDPKYKIEIEVTALAPAG